MVFFLLSWLLRGISSLGELEPVLLPLAWVQMHPRAGTGASCGNQAADPWGWGRSAFSLLWGPCW